MQVVLVYQLVYCMHKIKSWASNYKLTRYVYTHELVCTLAQSMNDE